MAKQALLASASVPATPVADAAPTPAATPAETVPAIVQTDAPPVATPAADAAPTPTVQEIGDPLTYGATPVTRPSKVRVKLNLDDAANYSKRIFKCVTSNPKKPGSQAAVDFLHYRDGMTLLAYLTDERMPRRRARANVQWDLEHGFIRLEDVKTA